MNKIVTARHVSVPQNILKKVFKNVLAAGAPRRTPLEEFTALPIRPSWILGGEGEARRKEGEEERRGKGEEGERRGMEKKG